MSSKQKYFGLGVLFGFLIIFIIVFTTIALPIANGLMGPNTIAIIPITGEISYAGSDKYVTTNPDAFKQLMNSANTDPSIGGIFLEINSPGGSSVASEEILTTINSSKKPVVAWISESGTSGAYLAASGADKIVASPSSWIGSIGTIITLTDLSKYYEKAGINMYSITGGEFKDMGANYRNLTAEEKDMIQKIVDDDYDHFITLVANNRNLSKNYVKTIAEGKLYSGAQGLDLKLIDEIGGKDDSLNLLANISGLGSSYNVVYLGDSSSFDGLSNNFFSELSNLGKNFGQGLI
jgi:protease-4